MFLGFLVNKSMYNKEVMHLFSKNLFLISVKILIYFLKSSSSKIIGNSSGIVIHLKFL